MAVFFKEIRQGMKALIVWTLATAMMLAVCVFMFPEMKSQMDGITKVFANMGAFTKAFGMDQLNFGELTGFYGVECGNVLGICGGFFAAYLGICSLSGEEKEHTAEFLMTHPISRSFLIWQKLLGVLVQIAVMNAVIFAISLLSVRMIGEIFPMPEFALLHFGYLLLQLEIALICFGISAFIRRGGVGIGLGLAAVLYFMDVICNISRQAGFLKYITPFSYAKPTDIISNGSMDLRLVLLGISYGIVFTAVGFMKYIRKDLAA